MMNAKKVIKTCLFTPGMNGAWGLPLALKSEPGMAKSTILTSVGRGFGFHVNTMLGSIRMPEEFGGLPTKGDGVVEVLPFPWVKVHKDNKFSILFCDELTCTDLRVQAAMLRVWLDRVVGDEVLPRTCRVMGAYNGVDDATGGTELSPAMANRMLHVDWDGGSPEDWIAWAIADGGDGVTEQPEDPAAIEAMVMSEWGHRYAMSRGLVTGFISRFRDLLHKKPEAGSPDLQRAWPSRRSWELLMRTEAGAAIHALDDTDREVLLEGCVGRAAAAQYLTYLAETALPDPRDVLDGKVAYKHTNRLDMTLAVFNSCAMLVAPATCERRVERAAALWTMLGATVDKHADVVVPAATALVQARLGTTKEALPVLTKVSPVFAAAGLIKGGK